MQTNEQCRIKLLVLNSNTWNLLIESKKGIIVIKAQHLEPFDKVQINEYCWIDLVLNSNTCKHYTACKLIINII